MSNSAETMSSEAPAKIPARRIAVLGMYGIGNIGNECTLEAMIANLHEKQPGVALTAVCPGPGDVRERHGINAIPFYSNSTGDDEPRLSDGPVGRLLRPFRILFRRIPEEIRGLSRATGIMQEEDMLLVGGTGILEDNSSWSINWVWNLAKWVLAAKRAGAEVAFVSIGAGPLHRKVDRWLIKHLLSRADYVSYRDDFSLDYMNSIKLPTATHFRFPDLAFGLTPEDRKKEDESNKTVAVGVMQYAGQKSSRLPEESVYESYVNNVSTLIRSLLDEGYDVKILYGDARYDLGIVADLKGKLADYSGTALLTQTEITEVGDVVRELASSRFVIASRFHNLILSLMLGKPTISISYHDKNDALLKMFGMKDYCHDIDDFDGGRLMEQFRCLVRNENDMESRILGTAARFRGEVHRQYDILLDPSDEPLAKRKEN